jgi:hypothetical protein
MPHIVICGLLRSTIFFHIVSYTARSPPPKKIVNTTCGSISPETFICNISHSTRSLTIYVLILCTVYSCQILMKLEFSEHVFQKYTNINFHANPQSGRRVVPCRRPDGQTDFTKPIVAIRSFANAPNNCPRQMYPAPFAFNPHNIFSKIHLTVTPPVYLDC